MKNVIAKKSLGQHFLNNEEALRQIVEAADLQSHDCVLEIGPGTGVLTCKLLERTEKVLAIEKDQSLAAGLKDRFQVLVEQRKLFVFSDDILKINISDVLEKYEMEKYKVVANIPYYITGKIIRLLIDAEHSPESIVLLIQKEVAERICAGPGRMNKLSTIVQYFGSTEIVATVPRESFDPVPEVDSAILKIIPHKKGKNKSCEDRDALLRIIKIGFSSPRKKLINNLSAGLKISKSETEKILKESDVDIKTRAQDMDIGGWKRILVSLESASD